MIDVLTEIKNKLTDRKIEIDSQHIIIDWANEAKDNKVCSPNCLLCDDAAVEKC
jgi:hypothetical protein